MDYESSISRENGCWDPLPLLEPFKEKWTSDTPTPDFEVDDEWCGNVIGLGFADSITPESAAFWNNTIKAVYKGDEGRKKVRMAAICLVGRDGLLLRVQDVKCPVHWLQVRWHANYTGSHTRALLIKKQANVVDTIRERRTYHLGPKYKRST